MAYHKILIAFDGSGGSWKALRKALLLARDFRADVLALSVEEHLPHFAGTVGEVQEAKEEENHRFARLGAEALEAARQEGVSLQTEVLPGHPAQTIVRYARQHSFDLIVIGHSGYSGAWGLLLGSTTDRVVDHAHCDVLVVR